MTLLFMSEWDSAGEWTRDLQAFIPDLEVRAWPDVGNAADIDVALAWKPPAGALATLPNLKLVQSLGMGVDHIFADEQLPEGVPVARLVDPFMAMQMSEYAMLWVLYQHRMTELYTFQQVDKQWKQHRPRPTDITTVGIMGLGVLGEDAARKFAMMGFNTTGWSRSEKSIAGVTCFHGETGLTPFLNGADYLVCLLPLTPETEAIINRETLAELPEGAYVINLARGGHLVEDDLLAAIDSEHIAGAALDVFQDEPPAPEHRFWHHPKIRMTPHIAGLTNARTCAEQVAENIKRIRAGEPALNLVDPAKGY